MANQIAQRASEMFYSDRTWPRVLAAAEVQDPDGSLLGALEQHDLKRRDAVRALSAIRQRLDRSPRLLDGDGSANEHRFTMARVREDAHDASGSGAAGASTRDLWQWLVATGRYRRHAAGAQTATHGAGRSTRTARTGTASRRRPGVPGPLPRTDREWMTALGLDASDLKAATGRSRTSRGLARQLMREDAPVARAVWSNVIVAGERDPLVSAFVAMRWAITCARHEHVLSKALHLKAAQAEIARAHGFPAWDRLHEELHRSPLWPWIERAVDELALARAVKQELFAKGTRWMGRPPLQADHDRGLS